MSYVFHGQLQFHLGENRSREQKGLGYPAALNEAAALRVHLPRKYKLQVTGTEKGTKRCFSSHDRGRRRSFATPNAPARESFRSSGDAQVPLATTEPITVRNYRNFPQRGIDGIHIGDSWCESVEPAVSEVEREVARIPALV